MSGWLTVWMIASKRYQTKEGEKTLSDNAFATLQGFVAEEQAQAMKDALGGVYRGLFLGLF